MLHPFKKILALTDLPKEAEEESFRALQAQYPTGGDPWGMNIDRVRQMFRLLWPVYNRYFRVRVIGEENLVKENTIFVANHSGQVAIDGVLICMAFYGGLKEPKIVRAMVERFLTKTPFLGSLLSELGSILGDRQNCLSLLRRGGSVLVFPEGLRGITKNSKDYYNVQHFSRGFYRMALESGVRVQPLAVVGAEEFYPWVRHARGLAKMIGLPALPLTPNLLPLPSPVDIHIGKPLDLPADLSPDSPDEAIDVHVEEIREQIIAMLAEGMKQRRSFPFNRFLKGKS